MVNNEVALERNSKQFQSPFCRNWIQVQLCDRGNHGHCCRGIRYPPPPDGDLHHGEGGDRQQQHLRGLQETLLLALHQTPGADRHRFSCTGTEFRTTQPQKRLIMWDWWSDTWIGLNSIFDLDSVELFVFRKRGIWQNWLGFSSTSKWIRNPGYRHFVLSK